VNGEIAHMLCLNPATELSAQFVGSGLNGRVVGDSHDRTIGAIEDHGDLGGLAKQLIEFFLERARRSIHESSPSWEEIHSPKLRRAADYHK
jgi:pyocin large subunit-like protein